MVHLQPATKPALAAHCRFTRIGPTLVRSHDCQYRVSAGRTPKGDIVPEGITIDVQVLLVFAAKISNRCHPFLVARNATSEVPSAGQIFQLDSRERRRIAETPSPQTVDLRHQADRGRE